MTKIQNFINGQYVDSTSQRSSNVYNPATGVVKALCPMSTTDEVNQTIEIAAKAGKTWAKSSQKTRREVIFRMRELLVRDTKVLAEIVSLEHGKTTTDAIGEVGRAIECVEFATNAGQLIKGDFSNNIGGNIDNFSLRQAVGVVGCIAPFNFPALVPLLTSAMAIACGNSVVLKPSEKVPSAALYLAKLWKEAGLPDGVWNVVNGDKEAVDALLQHPKVDAISFVGSTRIGEYIYQEGTKHYKKVACFNGGKNHMVVMPDADLDFVADSFIAGGFGDASQRCMAVSVLVTVGNDAVADDLVERIVTRAKKLTPGHYQCTNSSFGPVISKESKDSITNAVNTAVADGGKMVLDGRDPKVKGYENGFFLGPTLIDHVNTNSHYYKEEVFGPARAVVRAKTLNEAIDLINSGTYGNGAAIFTNHGGWAKQFYENVEAGGIGVNVPVPAASGSHDFGGLKGSRFGDAFLYGPDSARFFTKQKTISTRWNTSDGGDVFVSMYSNK